MNHKPKNQKPNDSLTLSSVSLCSDRVVSIADPNEKRVEGEEKAGRDLRVHLNNKRSKTGSKVKAPVTIQPNQTLQSQFSRQQRQRSSASRQQSSMSLKIQISDMKYAIDNTTNTLLLQPYCCKHQRNVEENNATESNVKCFKRKKSNVSPTIEVFSY